MFAGSKGMNNDIFLLLGSNQGKPVDHLAAAAEKIEEDAGKILARSSVYKTAAWGIREQPDFYNQVLQITSNYSPEVLLEKLLGIEQAIGRVRLQKWGPRIIDIDLLFYGQEVRNTTSLQLPHPGIPQRKFTLLPLAEITPDLRHPVSKKSIATLLAECTDTLSVEKISSTT